MRKISIALLTMVLLLAGCSENEVLSPQSPSDESVVDQQKSSSSETEMLSGGHTTPRSYAVPEGWEKLEKHSTDSQIFYTGEGHKNDEKSDNVFIRVGENEYGSDKHEQFWDAIAQQILIQLDGIEAQLNGDGTHTEQGDLLYIFTTDEDDIVITQHCIVKDCEFCLIQFTSFNGSETIEQVARDAVDSLVWNTGG